MTTNFTSCAARKSKKSDVYLLVVWLGSMIYGMSLWTSARCLGLFPGCGQDGYQAQVPQQPPGHSYMQIRYNIFIEMFWPNTQMNHKFLNKYKYFLLLFCIFIKY